MSRLVTAAAAGVLAILYGLLFAASVTTSLGLLFGSALAGYALDLPLDVFAEPGLQRVFTTVGASLPWRAFIRQVLLAVFLLRAHVLSATGLGVVVGAVLLHHVLAGLFTVLRTVIRRRRLRRVETRNLDVPGDELPAALPEWLNNGGLRVLLSSDLLVVAALGWALATGSYRLVVPAAVAMVLVAAGLTLVQVPQLLALRRLPDDEARMHAAERAVEALRPLVILYFSGGLASVYQVNMWLETMERLDRPVLVLLRERRYWDAVPPTTVPVLCLPFAVDMMNFPMPTARVALYVANVGKNIHLLREPHLKSAFIGHGDSDKTASFNPATKVYDEVWVAGEAGRERYRRAQVGVRDDEIVLVGRPQLHAIEARTARPVGDPFTVLYAPTWEGWTDDLNQSSVIPMGEQIVATLLATPGVRVVYKPHPLTGSVDPMAGEVSAAIVRRLAAAGAPHTAVLANEHALFDLFNSSDALISDISSVVSDYLQSDKPYFVTNPAGTGDDAFRDENPSAGAAYLIGPTAAGSVDGLVDGLAAARGDDGMRERRRAVRTRLLGDPAQDPMELFRAAVDALARRSSAEVEAATLRPQVASALQRAQRLRADDDDDAIESGDAFGDPEDAVNELTDSAAVPAHRR